MSKCANTQMQFEVLFTLPHAWYNGWVHLSIRKKIRTFLIHIS